MFLCLPPWTAAPGTAQGTPHIRLALREAEVPKTTRAKDPFKSHLSKYREEQGKAGIGLVIEVKTLSNKAESDLFCPFLYIFQS